MIIYHLKKKKTEQGGLPALNRNGRDLGGTGAS